jgi:SAM-dependent methyltransferase
MKPAQPAPWKDYFQNTKNNPPRPLLIKALEYVTEKGAALDVGAGALNDSKYLLSQGFQRVTALDKNDVAQEVAKTLPADTFEYIISSFEEFHFPQNMFNLVNAQYALPFIHPKDFKRVFEDMRHSLKKGGVFTGQFFGDRDGWKDNQNMTFVTREEAEQYLRDLEILSFEEEERDKKTAAGEIKHWHVFHFVARRKG